MSLGDRPSPKFGAAIAAAVIALAVPIVTHFEGRVLKTYPDVVHGWNVPTACDGHTGPELLKGQTFTAAECDEMLSRDLTAEFDGLSKCMPMEMPTNELAAYLDLAHNIGAGAVCESSIPLKLAQGNHAAACATITQFDGVKVKDVFHSCADPAMHCLGIIKRRAAERSLCEGSP